MRIMCVHIICYHVIVLQLLLRHVAGEALHKERALRLSQKK